MLGKWAPARIAPSSSLTSYQFMAGSRGPKGAHKTFVVPLVPLSRVCNMTGGALGLVQMVLPLLPPAGHRRRHPPSPPLPLPPPLPPPPLLLAVACRRCAAAAPAPAGRAAAPGGAE